MAFYTTHPKQNASLQRNRDSVRPVRRSELGEDMLHVDSDGAVRRAELIGNADLSCKTGE